MNLGHVSVPIEVARAAPELREYQKRAIAEIKHHYDRGVRRQILSMPTGLGKTVIFTRLHRELNLRKSVLVIAHRQELIDQTVDHYRRLGHTFGEDRTDAWYRNVSSDKRIWIATVQSLTHPKSRRAERLNPEDFDLVICDEAHHSVAKSYLSLCNHFGITQRRFKGLFVGVTATPVRKDGKSLGRIFDRAVCVIDIFKAIQDGWLVGIKYFQAHSGISIANVEHDGSGDFNLDALGRRIDQDERNSLIFKAWKQQADLKRTIAFCATVEHGVNVAATFRKHGVPAEAIHGGLLREDRVRILKDHRDGRITVLANCEILTEGYDDPDVECIIMGRPTQSQPLYVQMIGRGLRLPSGIDNLTKAKESGRLERGKKSQCIIIDVVDNWARHGLEVVTAVSLLGDSSDAAESSTRNVPQRQPVPPGGHAPTPEVFDAVHPRIKEIDLFAKRKRSPQSKPAVPIRTPAVKEGPLAKWGISAFDERYKRALHGRIVAYWRLVPGGPPYSFKRLKDPEYELVISFSAPVTWILSCKSAKCKTYARGFKSIVDAFGCGEWFVALEKQEPDLALHVPRTSAPHPIQRALLQIWNASAPAAQTFTEAEQRIVRQMR